MNFIEKLDYLISKNELNKHSFSEASGIRYTTIDAFYKKGYKNMKLSNFKAICDFFHVTMDSMVRDELEIEYYNSNRKNLHITKEEEILLQCYRSADDMHKGLAECAVGADKIQDTVLKDLNTG